MPRSRLLFLCLSLVLALAALLWLTASIQQLYLSAASLSPLLARLLVGALLLALTALAGLLVYYAARFLRRRSPRPRPAAPHSPVEAADQTLNVLQQQIDQVQDEVARRALQQRSQRVAQRFDGGALRVVVFGTGSTGKTSVLNAIAGRSVGDTGAAMGTTQAVCTYRLRFRNVFRQVALIDTPGLSEASLWGDERGGAARQVAAEADLILMVVDNDLQQSEYELLRSLLRVGKRLLLVFNKVDRYPNDEQEAILAQLKQRTADALAPQDVVAIAAAPAPVWVEGEQMAPPPQILPLLKRMAAILRQEGDDLIADNILLQSRQIGEAARAAIAEQRQAQAGAIIERYQWISGGVVAVMPLPMVDLLAAAAVNAQMVIELGRVYGCEVSIEEAKTLALSLARTLGGVGIVKGATELLTVTLRLNPGTILIGQGVQGVTAAYLTRIAGKSFAEYFRRQQTWGDGGMVAAVQAQFGLERREDFLKRFVAQAIAHIGSTPLPDKPAPPR
ncbi:MAG: YcjF family protein [Elainellaceae cyanobacterium]